MNKGQLSLLECYHLLGLESNIDYSFDNLVEILNFDPNALKYIPQEHQSKKLFKKFDIYKFPFQHIRKSLLNDMMISKFLELNPHNYKHLTIKQKKNPIHIMKAISLDGTMLGEVPEKVDQTKEMAEVAFNQTKKCFYSIKGKNLTQAMLNEYIKDCPDDFSWILSRSDFPTELKQDKEFIKLAIIHGSRNISYVDQNVDLCILSVQNHDDSYEHITIVDNPNPETTLKNLLNKKKLMDLMNV